MGAKHTPGPWKVYKTEALGLHVAAASEAVVARVRDAGTEADAALIASAPTLLGACRTVADALGDGLRVVRRAELEAVLRAAIAKAEGTR